MIEGKRKYITNFSWLVFEKICRLCVSFVVAAYVARYLGPGDYGLINFSLSFVGFFSVFVTLGLDGIIARNLVRDPGQESIILGTSFYLRIFGSVFGFIIVFITVGVTSYDDQTKLLVLIIATSMLFQPLGVLESLFQSRLAARYTTLANLWSMGLASVVRVLLVTFKSTVFAFAGVFVIEKMVLGSALYVFYCRAGRLAGRWQFSFDVAKKMLQDSWPLIFSGFVVMLYMRIDQVMIKEMLDNESLGYYSAAVYLAEGWYFIGMAVNSSLFPAIVSGRELSLEIYYDRLQRLYRLMAWLAISVALPVYFLADPLVAIIYGEAFQPAAAVLKVNVWTGVFVFLGVASSSWLVTENLQRISLIRTVIGASINVILNLALIPRYGIVGSAWATLIAQAFASYLAYAFVKTTRRTFMMQTKAFIPPLAEIRRLLTTKI